jgi:hypothetical protein
MKKVPTTRLVDDGLIFEINRQVLHPMGLALAVVKDPSNQASPETVVLVESDDEEGILFDEAGFTSGAAKFAAFFRKVGENRVARRIRAVGFARQTRSDQ